MASRAYPTVLSLKKEERGIFFKSKDIKKIFFGIKKNRVNGILGEHYSEFEQIKSVFCKALNLFRTILSSLQLIATSGGG